MIDTLPDRRVLLVSSATLNRTRQVIADQELRGYWTFPGVRWPLLNLSKPHVSDYQVALLLDLAAWSATLRITVHPSENPLRAGKPEEQPPK